MAIEQNHINLMQLVNTNLRRHGRYYAGPCPLCKAGKDRFVVKVDTNQWLCRMCSPSYGDPISFIMKRDSSEFVEACKTLNIELEKQKRQPHKPRPQPPVHMGDLPDDYACFQPAWQRAADKFITETVNLFWSDQGKSARQYLANRGIKDGGWFELGFNPVERREKWGSVDVWLPRGIVIPWEIDGQYWRVRIRRSPADMKPGNDLKYVNVAGAANAMYGIQFVRLNTIVIMVEGEFDKLLLGDILQGKKHQGRSFVTVATGGTGNGRLLRWAAQLALADKLLLAFDDDQPDKNGARAGDVAAAEWLKVFPNARRLRPTCHDVTDMGKAGQDILQWVGSALK